MAAQPTPPVFISLRYAEAEEEGKTLLAALARHGIASYINDSEADCDDCDGIHRALAAASVYVVLASKTYGVNTGSPVCTYRELQTIMRAVEPGATPAKELVLVRMIPRTEQFAEPLTAMVLGSGDLEYIHWAQGTELPVRLVHAILTKVHELGVGTAGSDLAALNLGNQQMATVQTAPTPVRVVKQQVYSTGLNQGYQAAQAYQQRPYVIQSVFNWQAYPAAPALNQGNQQTGAVQAYQQPRYPGTANFQFAPQLNQANQQAWAYPFPNLNTPRPPSGYTVAPPVIYYNTPNHSPRGNAPPRSGTQSPPGYATPRSGSVSPPRGVRRDTSPDALAVTVSEFNPWATIQRPLPSRDLDNRHATPAVSLPALYDTTDGCQGYASQASTELFNRGMCYAIGQGVPQDWAQAAQWYRKAAEQGHAEAQFNLGSCYYVGQGVLQDRAQAAAWLRKAAEQGHARAQNNLGVCYSIGHGVPEDNAEAAAWLRKAAEKGLAEAQFTFGDCYSNGKVVPQDHAQAAAWFLKEAEQGNAGAQCALGQCYLDGKGVPEDWALAVTWFYNAAAQGNAKAQYNLGDCYFNGKGVPRDWVQAATWFHTAAQQGHAEAQLCLGRCYANGTGVPRDWTQEFAWYRKAAEQGLAEAQRALARSYAKGQGILQDWDQAAAWYRMAAEQGHAEAQVCLGARYANGQGVPQDWAQAAQWYRKAAENGYAEAQFNLGNCYSNGKGVSQDHTEAAEWYRKAARQGNAEAQFNLATCYANGQGVPQDHTEAYAWYHKAAKQGGVEAQFYLASCYANGQGVPQDHTKAVAWYRKAADRGNAKAQHSLGYCYEMGWGVPKDFREAVAIYRKLSRSSDEVLTLDEEGILRATAHGDTAVGVPTRFFEPPYLLRMGTAEQAAHDLERHMAVDAAVLHAAIAKGVDAIIEEVAMHAITTPDGKEVESMLRYILYEPTSEKIYANGIRDRGRGSVTLDHFLQHPNARDAALKRVEVIALRLYTTVAFKAINDPLRKNGQPVQLPVTTYYAAEAIKKLRILKVRATQGRISSSHVPVWRGMRTVAASIGFLENGGTELAFMSTSQDLSVAVRYSLSSTAMLFKIVPDCFMQVGAELQWLSAFPDEEEILYPPLTFLKPTKRTQRVTVKLERGEVNFTVVEVQPFY